MQTLGRCVVSAYTHVCMCMRECACTQVHMHMCVQVSAHTCGRMHERRGQTSGAAPQALPTLFKTGSPPCPEAYQVARPAMEPQ